MAEWSIAAVLKTVELRGSGGSNPSLSADNQGVTKSNSFFYVYIFGVKTVIFNSWRYLIRYLFLTHNSD